MPARDNARSEGARPERYRVVFVGAFRDTAQDGSVGGSLYAARALANSPLTQHVDWILIDTTTRSVPPPSIPIRAWLAATRLLKFIAALAKADTRVALIFAGGGLGFFEKGLMAAAASAARTPVLFSPRSGFMTDTVRGPLRRNVARLLLRRCDAILCQGETWRAFYKDLTGLPEDRLVTITNWVDLSAYPERGERPSSEDFVILYLGWLEHYKGILDLITALHMAGDALARARVIVCGRGSAMGEARALAERLGLAHRVQFRGWVLGSEKLAALTESDVFALPSHKEGLPNALLEAMASGLPVVASRVGAVPDVITHGVNGLLIDPGDTLGLSRALTMIATSPQLRAGLGREARATIVREHALETAWPRVLEQIERVVRASAARHA